MRIVSLISIFLGIISISKSQDNHNDMSHLFTVINLPEYFKEMGVIFSKDYVIGIEMQNFQSRYTPTKDDIVKAEKILGEKYNEIRTKNIDAKAFFCHWVRQYVGLIDINGNKNVIVQLIDNKKPRKINRLLGKEWEFDFVTMLSDDFYRVSTRFRINLDTRGISDKL